MRVTLAIPVQMEMLPGRPSLSLNLAAPGSLFHHSPELLLGGLRGDTVTLYKSGYLYICNVHFQFEKGCSLCDVVFLQHSLHRCSHNTRPPAATGRKRWFPCSSISMRLKFTELQVMHIQYVCLHITTLRCFFFFFHIPRFLLKG